MGKIGRTIELAKASLEVLKADKELLLLPVLSFLASAVVAATFLVPTLLVVDEESPLTYVIAFVAYVALAYVTIFFNTALVSAADERLQGGDPTLGSALRGASQRAGRIFPWAIVSATVSVLLRALEERAGIVGRIAAGLAGLAWGLVTFLVIPVLVIEDVPVRDAIRRSGQLFKRTWGENVVAMVGFGLLGFLAILPAVALIALAVTSGNGAVAGIAVAVAVVWMVGTAVVLSALNAVFQTALYRYAVDGEAVGPFTPEIMESAFAPKR
jgi:hypothetical protein